MSQSPAAADPHRRERDLLLLAARVHLTPAQAHHLADLARPEFDWAYLLDTAHRHGVLPLLHTHLRNLPGVPGPVRERLQTHTQANAARNLFLTGELLRLLPLFDAHGIAALPFKGPTLAALAYGSLSLREFGDLDLLVPEAKLRKAKALLVERGYRVQYDLSPRQEAAYLRTIRQLPLSRDDGCIVELHAALTPRSFAFPLDVEQLWRRRDTVALLGRAIPAPCPEDLLLILCMHGAKHLWKNLGWICDVAELLRVCPHLDWPLVRRRARAVRGRRMLDLGLGLARRVLGAPAPVGTDPVAAALARWVGRRLFAEEEGRAEGLASLWFHLQLREELGDGMAYGLSLLVEPTPADWQAGESPAWLPFGDYLRRPLRLAGKYSRALVRGRL